MEGKNKKNNRKEPTVAPEPESVAEWPDATKEDKRRGNVTKATRLVLDENDPS